MKHLITLSMSFLITTTSYADFTPACGKEYQKISRQSEYRQIISEQKFQHGDDLELLNKMERKALAHYQEKMESLTEDIVFSVQLAKYADKKNERQSNGYRVRIQKVESETSQVSYYLSRKGNILKSYSKNQSPIHNWICEGFDTDKVKLIKTLAEEFGEYFDYQDSDLGKHIRRISFEKLPKKARQFAEKESDSLTEDMQALDPMDDFGNYSTPADEQYEIVKDGVVIGYVISLWDHIDHPLWDGSGHYYYVRADTLEVILDHSWNG